MKRGSLLAALALWGGCGEGFLSGGIAVDVAGDVTAEVGTGSSEAGSFSVDDQTNHFTLSGGGSSYSATKVYSWYCGADQANVYLEGGLPGGSIRVVVSDALSETVYDNTYSSLLSGGVYTFTRPGGAAGLWTVKFTFQNATWGGEIELIADTADAPDQAILEGGYTATSTFVVRPGWQAGSAAVDVGEGLSSGSIRIRVWNPNGALVYDHTFSAVMGTSVHHTTGWGPAGTWWVRIDLVDAVAGGTISLSAS